MSANAPKEDFDSPGLPQNGDLKTPTKKVTIPTQATLTGVTPLNGADPPIDSEEESAIDLNAGTTAKKLIGIEMTNLPQEEK